MEHDGGDGIHELFGDHNLENDLRHFMSPGGSPHLTFSLPDHGQDSAVPALEPSLHGKPEHGVPPGRREIKTEGRAGEPWISERELREHFGIPLNEVATKFGICTSALKRLCRKYGVMRWPHRRLQTIEKRMQVIEDELRTTVGPAGRGLLQSELAGLQREREGIYEGRLPAAGGEEESNRTHAHELPTKRPAETTAEPAPHPSAPTRHNPPAEGRKGGTTQKLLGKGSMERGHSSVMAPDHGGYIGSDDMIMGPEMGGGELSHGGRGEGGSEMERLAEENASLRAISNYLMQERKDLASKAELSAKRNENLECLLRVLRLKVGVIDEYRTSAPIDPGALVLLEQLVGADELEVEEGKAAQHALTAEAMLASDEAGRERRLGGGQGRNFHQEMGWLSAHGGEHTEDLLRELM